MFNVSVVLSLTPYVVLAELHHDGEIIAIEEYCIDGYVRLFT